MEPNSSQDRTDRNELQRTRWHKPQVLRLVVNLDTSTAKPGSAADGPSFDRVVGPGED